MFKSIVIFFILLYFPYSYSEAPKDIQTNQRAWFDGLDVTGVNNYVSNPGAVSLTSWKDKSPQAYTAGAATSFTTGFYTYPTYSPGNGVYFDGAYNILQVTGGIYPSGTTTNNDIFVVATTNAIVQSFLFVQGPINNNSNRISAHIPWVDSTLYWDQNVGTGRLSVAWGSTLSRRYLWRFKATATTRAILRNNVSWATGAASGNYTNAAGHHFYIGGGENTSSNNHIGTISEMIMYNRTLTVAENRILLNYLNRKWVLPDGIGAESRYSSTTYPWWIGGIGRESDGNATPGSSYGLSIANNTFLNANGKYLLFGLPSQNPATGLVTLDIPTTMNSRANRIWYLERTGSATGTVNMSFDLTAMGISGTSIYNTCHLLYRSGTTGTFTILNSIQYSGATSVSFNGITAPTTGYYTIGFVGSFLNITKVDQVLSDPINLTTNPKRIPLAEIAYTLTVSNQGPYRPDSATITIDDSFNNNLNLYVGNYSGTGAPFLFIEGTPASGLTFPFVSLASTTDSVDFLNAANTLITPVPDVNGYDPLVRKIRFKPSGVFNIPSGSNPNLQLKFKMQVK